MEILDSSIDPIELLVAHGREEARLSQTDVTDSPVMAFYHARTAYEIGIKPDVKAVDITLAGEAAAKASFLLTKIGKPLRDSGRWIGHSLDALQGDDPRIKRERIATYLLAGRGTALRLLRDTVTGSPDLEEPAATMFLLAHQQVRATRDGVTGRRYDPYETMLAKHHATFEASRPHGRPVLAAQLALSGIRAAVLSDIEAANQPASGRISKEHIKFVAKQATGNLLALGLAISRPAADISDRIKQAHVRSAIKILG